MNECLSDNQMQCPYCGAVITIDGTHQHPWNTGTPTEEGYYLLRLNYTNYLFDVAFLKDGKFKSTHDHEIAVSYIVAWQRLEPYKEND